MPEWTSEQKKAIESRNGTILVSAAAGSGKTAVLVERVIQRLTDEAKPCGADRLLIVTFTRAATQQMKDRIYEALCKEIEKNPENSHLRRQLTLLPFAKISTIDSFCNDIVRENFHSVDLTPDYRLLEGAQLKILQNDVMTKLMDELYKENSYEFTELLNVLANGTDDSAVSGLIFSLYNYSEAFAEPEKWLDGLLDEYRGEPDLNNGLWGQLIKKHTLDALEYCKNICGKMSACAEDDEKVLGAYGENILQISDEVNSLYDVVSNGTWDEIRESFGKCEFDRLGSLRGYSSPASEYIKNAKAEIKKMTDKLQVNFCASEDENREDMEYLRPIAEKLVGAVRRYAKLLKEEKIKLNSFDFSDIAHYALDLLIKYDENGNAVKTELAESYSKKFDEILVDEFQDINDMQNKLFSAISDNEENLFTVGDVKQSIYRFRQAMPEIFLNRRDFLEEYTDGNYPAKINLDRNFRSRSGVTENINFVFSQLMHKELGGIDYNGEEALVCGADYESADFPQTELHIIGELQDGSRVNREAEAQHIADTIRKIISEKMQVRDKDGYRDVSYRDFCILMRASSNRAGKYADVLERNGIPVYLPEKSGFFASTEISDVINLIRVIDNPMQDIPLLATMLSPVFGFTADDMAKMRIEERNLPLYHCLLKYANGGNRKSVKFLESIEALRMLSSTLPCDVFIREMYEITGFKAIVCAMENGAQRCANLSLFADYASKYEETGKRGLSGFVRFIDRVQKQNYDMESASDISETADVVRIMTVHKSKGLEFPVCILADLSAKFFDETKNTASFHPEYGLCFDIRNSRKKYKYPTVGKKALAIAEKRSGYAEELRILYVAMTRAKERLICVARYDNITKKLAETADSISANGGVTPYMILNKNNFAEWLYMAFMRHPDANTLRKKAGFDSLPVLQTDAQMNVKIIDNIEYKENTVEKTENKTDDGTLYEEIKNRIECVYPYSSLAQVKAKSSPSEFDSAVFNAEYFAKTKPSFLSKSGINPAKTGTAMHKFMEFFDYQSDDWGIDSQIKTMLMNNRLTPDEANALEKKKLEVFFNGEIAKRIKNSPLLMREKKVTVSVKAGELYRDLPDNVKDEAVVIQGYVDCAFEENGELVIVDYKTDRGADGETLAERYRTQLKMYEYALHEITGMNVSCTLIYSFDKGTYIKA